VRQGYLVRRTFVHDSKLEVKFVNDKKKIVSGGFYIYIIYLFIYKYSNLFFKLEVYEDDIGDMLVQEQSCPDKSDQEKNSKRNVITKDIEQVWCLSVGIIMIIFYIIKYSCFPIRQCV
jgi:hypothetical protein